MAKTFYTAVQHSAFAFKQDKCFEHGLQPVSISSLVEIEKVKKAGGVIFEDYSSCDNYCYTEMYANAKGLTPQVKGTFARSTIDGMRIYVSSK